ncbi:MAG: translation initiation factor IF-3 [Phycisphaeraceae bacterium]|nr:translation initiation factor IF-3 [Phycisphaeraceae bacterium]
MYRNPGPVRRTRTNEMIRISPVRLIDENNKQVGIVETAAALQRAREVGLDLVEISPDERPPICKITDYGKYKYELSKKDSKSRSASKASDMKEVRLGRSVKIDPHDVEIRVNQARKFLIDGHKVLVVQRFRGREMMHSRLGMERMQEIATKLEDVCKIETPPKASGRAMNMVLAPDKQKVETYKRKLEKAKAAAASTAAAAGVAPAPAPAESKAEAKQPAPAVSEAAES